MPGVIVLPSIFCVEVGKEHGRWPSLGKLVKVVPPCLRGSVVGLDVWCVCYVNDFVKQGCFESYNE